MKPRRTKHAKETPVRAALLSGSTILPDVRDGLAAMINAHRGYIDAPLRSEFADSLDLDEAMRVGHDQEHRWDYLLGHAPTGRVVGLEPHSAKQDEISTIIKKRTAARNHLQAHLKPSARVATWLWVASGKVHFANTEKARFRLDQNGIRFVGTIVLRKHLPDGTT